MDCPAANGRRASSHSDTTLHQATLGTRHYTRYVAYRIVSCELILNQTQTGKLELTLEITTIKFHLRDKTSTKFITGGADAEINKKRNVKIDMKYKEFREIRRLEL